MKKISRNNVPVLQFKKIKKIDFVDHLVSTREGGISKGLYKSFNLGYNTQDKDSFVKKNRQVFARLFNVKEENLIFPEQTHGSRVGVIRVANKNDIGGKDALITNLSGKVLAIQSADCVPLLLVDPVNKVVGALHAGWKGIHLRIIQNVIGKMHRIYGSAPKDLIVGIGPAISQMNYEVGEEVVALFEKEFSYAGELIERRNEKMFLDLKKAAYLQLQEYEVLENQIEVADECTYTDKDLFFSYRGAKDGDTGRFASAIMIR